MMKKRRSWIRFFSGLLILSLLMSLPFGASAEETAHPEQDEWNIENSILVYWTAPEFRTFSPEDFPEIDCRRVVTIHKEPNEDGSGINFTLVLVLKEEGAEAVTRALEIARQDERLNGSYKNEEYEKEQSRAVLNHSQYVLKLGETLELEMVRYYEEMYTKEGVYFKVDPTAEGHEVITKDSFQAYGISRFWPCDYIDTWWEPCFLVDRLEGTKNEKGQYYALPNSEHHAFEIADALARDPSVLFVGVASQSRIPPGGIYWNQTWKVDDTMVAQISKTEGRGTTVQGIQPGMAIVTFTSDKTASETVTATCTVTVVDEYQQGDIDRNLDIGASDALKALQHSVKLITLDEEQQGLADMDENGAIDAKDALIILQITVGIL